MGVLQDAIGWVLFSEPDPGTVFVTRWCERMQQTAENVIILKKNHSCFVCCSRVGFRVPFLRTTPQLCWWIAPRPPQRSEMYDEMYAAVRGRPSLLCRWKLEKYKAPAFVGGPYEIWGLTGYILHRLVNDVIRQHLAVK